jgi:hypothetical protein
LFTNKKEKIIADRLVAHLVTGVFITSEVWDFQRSVNSLTSDFGGLFAEAVSLYVLNLPNEAEEYSTALENACRLFSDPLLQETVNFVMYENLSLKMREFGICEVRPGQKSNRMLNRGMFRVDGDLQSLRLSDGAMFKQWMEVKEDAERAFYFTASVMKSGQVKVDGKRKVLRLFLRVAEKEFGEFLAKFLIFSTTNKIENNLEYLNKFCLLFLEFLHILTTENLAGANARVVHGNSLRLLAYLKREEISGYFARNGNGIKISLKYYKRSLIFLKNSTFNRIGLVVARVFPWYQ